MRNTCTIVYHALYLNKYKIERRKISLFEFRLGSRASQCGCKMTARPTCLSAWLQHRKDYKTIVGHRARRTISRHIDERRRQPRRARRLLLLIIISGYFCTASYNVVGSLPARPTGAPRPLYLLHLIARDTLKRRVYCVYARRETIISHAYTHTYIYICKCVCMCINGTCKRNYRQSHPRVRTINGA